MNKHIGIIFGALLLVWACLPGNVSAHAYISQSTPLQDAELSSSPSEIRITFTEKIDTKLSTITLSNSSDGSKIAGKLSSDGDFTLVYTIPKLGNGIYKVVWQVLSLDTHVTDGSYRFAVGEKLTRIKPDETASLDGGQEGQNGPAGPDDQGQNEQNEQSGQNGQDGLSSGGSGGSKNQETAGGSSSGAGASVKPPATAKPEASAKPSSSATPDVLDELELSPSPNQGEAGVAAPDPSASPGVPDSDGITASNEQPDSRPPAEIGQDESSFPIEGEGESGSWNEAGELWPESDADGEHHHAGGTGLMAALRILDVIASAFIAAQLFFRYFIWRDSELAAPFGFSMKAERLLTASTAILWIITGLWRLSMLSNDLGGLPLSALASGTMVGKIAVLRPVAAMLLLLLAFAPERERLFATAVKIAAAAAIILTFPLTGHAYAAANGALAAVIGHAVHMAAAGIWLGGLAGLLSLTHASYASSVLNGAAGRFSVCAFPSMMLIIVSGVWMSASRLSSWKQLVDEDYGRLIAVKTILLLLVLAVAALHRLVFMPRLAKAKSEGGAAAPALRGLIVGVRAEIVLAAGLFILAGMLSTASPPSEEAQASNTPFYWHVMGEDAHMTLRIDEDNDKDSQFARLYVWLPEELGAPEEVAAVVALQPAEGQTQEGRQRLPLALQPAEAEPTAYPGVTKYSYTASGKFLDASAGYLITIDITDSLGETHHFERSISE